MQAREASTNLVHMFVFALFVFIIQDTHWVAAGMQAFCHCSTVANDAWAGMCGQVCENDAERCGVVWMVMWC